jgi:hypothetical protein
MFLLRTFTEIDRADLLQYPTLEDAFLFCYNDFGIFVMIVGHTRCGGFGTGVRDESLHSAESHLLNLISLSLSIGEPHGVSLFKKRMMG